MDRIVTILHSLGKHQGHHDSTVNPFYTSLLTLNDSLEAILTFLNDRAVLLSQLEQLILPQTSLSALAKTLDISAQQAAHLFHRSAAYKATVEAIQREIRKENAEISVELSPAASNYCDYVRSRASSSSILALHLWMFLIGELFGGIVIANAVDKNVHSKLEGISSGGAQSSDFSVFLKDFHAIPKKQCIAYYNEFIYNSGAIAELEGRNQLDGEVAVVYNRINEMMDDAHKLNSHSSGNNTNNNKNNKNKNSGAAAAASTKLASNSLSNTLTNQPNFRFLFASALIFLGLCYTLVL
jgi:hypothetical protein